LWWTFVILNSAGSLEVFMTRSLLALVCIPALAAAQQDVTLSRPVTMEIRSLDSHRVSRVSIEVRGKLFDGVGVLGAASGQVHCGPAACIATTPAVLELSAGDGEGTLSRSDRSLIAYGHRITFARDSRGQLVVRAPRLTTRF
jgi:hypothetical protein